MRYVIIGNGAAGNAAAQAIVSRDPAGQVIIVSNESHESYYRPLIPNLIDGSVDKNVLFRDEITQTKGVKKRLGVQVEGIDPQGKFITLEKGEQLPYDRLLIATGSNAIRPRIPGMEAGGVHTLRTLDDAEAIRKAAEGQRSAVIIGAGRVGIKTASVLRHRRLEVSVVEMLGHVVPLQFDKVAGELLGSAIEGQGIRLVTGHAVKRVTHTEGRVSGVELDDGRRIEAQLVVVATGVSADTELAREAGIAVNRGVLVDEFLRTSVSNIYAAGDVCETRDLLTDEPLVSGLWTNAVEMGTIAGRNMSGEEVAYGGAFSVLNSLEVANIPTISIGLTNPPRGEDYEVKVQRHGDRYRKLVIKRGVLVGALLVGDVEGAGVFTGLIKRKSKIEPFIDILMAPRPSFAPWLAGDLEIPGQKA